MLKKIRIAREIAEKIQESTENPVLSGTFLKLKETADKVELAYNDARVKRFKSRAASERMNEFEKQLDELLIEAVKVRNSKSDT